MEPEKRLGAEEWGTGELDSRLGWNDWGLGLGAQAPPLLRVVSWRARGEAEGPWEPSIYADAFAGVWARGLGREWTPGFGEEV